MNEYFNKDTFVTWNDYKQGQHLLVSSPPHLIRKHREYPEKELISLRRLVSTFKSLVNDIAKGNVTLEESFIDKGSNKVVIKLSATYEGGE